MVLGVVLGGLVMIGVMVFGLVKMSGEEKMEDASLEKLVDGAGWVIGGEDYKVTVVEFSDLQCPACKRFKYVYRELKETDGVRYVFRYLPLLTIHKNAWKAAKAAETAKRMGKGWEMMELLFEKQDDWGNSRDFEEKARGYAKELGLNEEEFITLYEGGEIEAQVVKDNALAGELNISGTPTFFVEGEQVAANFVLTKVEELLKEK